MNIAACITSCRGLSAPLTESGPKSCGSGKLLSRLATEEVKEVILSTNPNIEGEATTLYLITLLKELPVKVTTIAHGVPVGGDLEYADEITLGRALEGRRVVASRGSGAAGRPGFPVVALLQPAGAER